MAERSNGCENASRPSASCATPAISAGARTRSSSGRPIAAVSSSTSSSVVRSRQEQSIARRRRERLKPAGERVLEQAADGRRLRPQITAGEVTGIQPTGELQQREWIAVSDGVNLAENCRRCAPRLVHGAPDELRGRLRRQRLDVERRQIGRRQRIRLTLADRGNDRDGLVVETPGAESECLGGGAVDPLHVIDEHSDGTLLGLLGEQRQQSGVDREATPEPRRPASDRGSERIQLRRCRLQIPPQRREQHGQPGVQQFRLGLDPRHVEDEHAVHELCAARSSAVLPIPASPWSTKAPPRPSRALSRTPCIASSSADLPTSTLAPIARSTNSQHLASLRSHASLLPRIRVKPRSACDARCCPHDLHRRLHRPRHHGPADGGEHRARRPPRRRPRHGHGPRPGLGARARRHRRRRASGVRRRPDRRHDAAQRQGRAQRGPRRRRRGRASRRRGRRRHELLRALGDAVARPRARAARRHAARRAGVRSADACDRRDARPSCSAARTRPRSSARPRSSRR